MASKDVKVVKNNFDVWDAVHCGKSICGKYPFSTSVGAASATSCFVSGVILGLLQFVFAILYAQMLWDQIARTAVPMGVGMMTMSTGIGAFFFSHFSGYKVIGGPDINPVIFVSEAAVAIVKEICPGGTATQRATAAASAAAGSAAGRRLAGSGSDSSVSLTCENEDMVIPTVLVATAIATLIMGTTFTLVGKLRITELIGYLPANVVSGFMSCIGYKVFVRSIEIACPVGKPLKWVTYGYKYFHSWYEHWMFIVPMVPIGWGLFYLKRAHPVPKWMGPVTAMNNPTVFYPVLIIVPTIIFYIVIYGQGYDLDDARTMGWMFKKAETNQFWNQWVHLYGGMAQGKVAWGSLSAAIPSWIVMIVICTLDDMLKLASTEAKLQLDYDYNHEIIVGGVATYTSAVLAGITVYSQTKFNVLNFGIVKSTTEMMSGVVCSIFHFILFLSGFPLINYIPRLVLAGLLFQSAIDFLVEHLYDSYKKYNKLNFAAVWIMWITNVLAGEVLPAYGLLIAFAVGVLSGTIIFVVEFVNKTSGKSNAIAKLISGDKTCSTAILTLMTSDCH